MVKLLVFAILLASSPATGLLEQLFRMENDCHTGCATNYAAKQTHLDACRKGCNFKLHNEDCAGRCKSLAINEEHQASCQVGCTLSRPVGETAAEKPIIAVDPVPETKDVENVPVNSEPDRPRSIILIRLRQRPSFEIPSVQRFFNGDPIQMFNDMIKQFQEQSNKFEESIRKSFDEKSKDLPKLPEFGTLSEFVKSIPIVPLPGNIRADSSSESSEENSNKRPLTDEIRHVVEHPREHQLYIRERIQAAKDRVHQFLSNVRTEWLDFVRRQPKIPIWIFIGLLLASSAILWYMAMSLCRQAPSRNTLSVRAQELIFHPYEYDAYEKEKIQPDEQPYEVTESLPIKVKFSNI